MLYWWFRLDTSRSGARWIDGDIPAAGVRRRRDTQVRSGRTSTFLPPERTTLSPGRAAQKELRLPRANRALQASVSP